MNSFSSFPLLPQIYMFGEYIIFFTVVLQMLQLNIPQYVTNVALNYLTTFIIYNGITIIIKGR